MQSDEKDHLDEPETNWGESLEQVVVEIKNLLPLLESAFSGVEYAAVALRAQELGFDRSTAFWPVVFPKETTYGMAWSDDPELVVGIEPPPDLSAGWKLDPHYGDRVRYWNGEEWDLVSTPAPANLDLFKSIAAGEDVGEVPEAVTIHPANSKEPNLLLEMLTRRPEGETRAEESSSGQRPGGGSEDD